MKSTLAIIAVSLLVGYLSGQRTISTSHSFPSTSGPTRLHLARKSSSHQADHLQALLELSLIKDPDELRMLLELEITHILESRPRFSHTTTSLIQRWAEIDPEGLVTYLTETQPLNISVAPGYRFRLNPIAQLAKHHPDIAIQVMQRLPKPDQADALLKTAGTHYSQDPDAAFAILQEHAELLACQPDRSGYASLLRHFWLQSDALTARITTLPPGQLRKRLIASLAQSHAQAKRHGSPVEVWQWWRQLAHAEDRHAALHGLASHREIPKDLYPQIVESLAKLNHAPTTSKFLNAHIDHIDPTQAHALIMDQLRGKARHDALARWSQ